MSRRAEPEQADIILAWDEYLDGRFVSETHRYSLAHLSLATVRGITQGPPPDSMKDDPRLRGHGYFYLPCSVVENALAMLIIRQPLPCQRGAFRLGLRGVLRLAKVDFPGLYVDPCSTAEMLEHDVAERMLLRRPEKVGLGYAFDVEGKAFYLTEADLHVKREDLPPASDAPTPDVSSSPTR